MIPPMTYDGKHLLADLYGCPVLDDVGLIEKALRAAADSAKATVIGLHLHHFGPRQGITGVALLAESHMSIHTWPEHGYAAIDIFLCGAHHDPIEALQTLSAHLCPTHIKENLVRRGDQSELGRQ